MKKFLFFLFVAGALSAQGQVELVQQFPYDYLKTKLVYIDHGMPKLITNDIQGFQVYNMDYTLYADVEYPTEMPNTWLTYVSRSLVDCDTTQLEFFLNGPQGVMILREDGTALLELEEYHFSHSGLLSMEGTMAPIVSDEAGSYVILDQTGVDTLRLYQLCGQVPQALARNSDGSVVSGIMPPTEKGSLRVFPNPGSDRIQLDYDLQGNSTGRVFLYNTAGTLVYENRLGAAFDHIYIDISRLASGTYIAKIATNDGLILTEKFVKIGH